MRVVLDMNSIIRAVEAEDEALTALLRLGHAHKVEIRVTDTASQEAADDADSSRRARRCRQVRGFPTVLNSPPPSLERLTVDLYTLVFGTKSPASTSRSNREADARHLAESILGGGDVFVTSDQEILSKADVLLSEHCLRILGPLQALEHIESSLPKTLELKPLVLPNVLIRPGSEDDLSVVRDLLSPLADDYPGFGDWLEKRWRSVSARRKIATVDGRVVGVSISEPKDSEASVVKLSTFFVGEEFREAGIGQHLLFHELRSCARDGTRKVFVTVSSNKPKMVRFFTDLGFVVEGVSAGRYKETAYEVILARHLLHITVTEGTLPDLAVKLVREVFCADVASASSEVVEGTSALPERIGPVLSGPIRLAVGSGVSPETRRRHKEEYGSAPLVEVVGSNGFVDTLDALDLESRFYPLRLALESRPAFVVPIRKEWAQALFQWSERQLPLLPPPADKRFLRLDNVYYCAPRYADQLHRGTPILFYVTNPPQQAVGLVGSALVEHVETDDPETLFVRFGGLGIYGVDDIQGHINERGDAMAIRFTWFEPFEEPLVLQQVKDVVPKFNPQTLYKIGNEEYRVLRANGERRPG